MMIYNTIYNILKNLLNTTTRVYIFINKKYTWWGISTKFFNKSMSDNVHYVNLIGYLVKNKVKVGKTFYFFLKVLDLPRPLPIIRNKIKRVKICL